MKKIFVCLFTLLLAFALVGCDSQVKITFESNEGTSVTAITAKAGEAIVKPADPTLTDMTFGGWYSDIDLTEKYEFPAVMPSTNIKLYAKWLVTLKFNTKGAGTVTDLVGESGEFFKAPENPKKEGFVFVGWYMDEDYQTPLVTVLPKKNSTAYARWQVYETGSAITLVEKWNDNDGAFLVSHDEAGDKFVASSGKGEWSYVYRKINCDASANTTVVVEFKGTLGCPVVFKLEGGDAAVTEIKVDAMTGENQVLEWSVKSENLTQVGGQMFMFFLNGGTVGCSETPEYIQIKSVKLYRTLEADDEQKAAIYFNPNQGTKVDTIYVKAGTAITEPAEPTRDGYKFMGWFTESTFENEFVFTVMPTEGAMLYAKWEADGVILPDINLLGGEWTIGAAGTYEIVSEDAVLKIKKTATGAEWDWIALPMTGKELATYKTLRVSLVGEKGQKVLFKINDAVEKWVTCTGKLQEIELPFDVALNPEKSLFVFANAGVTGESCEFVITRLAYGNYDCYQNLLDGNWALGENCIGSVEFNNGVLVLSKIEGGEWDHIRYDLAEVNLDGYNLLRVTVKGTDGEQVLLKVNDQKEKWVTCDGTEQVVEFLFDLEYNYSKATMLVFANPGSTGSGNNFEFTQFELLKVANPVDIELNNATWTSLDAGVYTINKENTISKAIEGYEWDNIAIQIGENTLEGINKLLVTIKGVAGQEIMLKVNDQGGDLEKRIVCTGEVQELEFDLDFTYNAEKAAMIIFCNPGVRGTGEEFVISRLIYKGAEKEINLLQASWNVPEVYELTSKILISKVVDGAEWACTAVTVQDANYFGLTKLVVNFKGPEGETIIFKLNDEGGAYEKSIVCTGTDQEVTIDITHEMNLAKAALIVFCNGGSAGTGHEFVIYSALFTK